MPTPSAQQEPTMEEILASIRRIISEDADPAKAGQPAATTGAGQGADVLELTNIVHDDGSVGGAAPEPVPEPPRRRAAPPPMREPEPYREAAREPAPEPRVSRRAAPAPAPEPPRHTRHQSDLDMVDKEDRDSVLSTQASSAISNAFGALTRERDVAVGGGTTLEEIVAQMMKPMLAAWLDEHLPEIVERVVQQEVERAARGGGRRR
jgi:cell pole-organizing protein PopZ